MRTPLTIALVNNMPDTAFLATERQFTRLAREAGGETVTVDLYRLPAIARGETVQDLLPRYRPHTDLFRRRPDAIIVTGTEPKAPRFEGEAYWSELVALIDWAKASRIPALWSCLAAHAAVLHLDGIERQRLPRKLSGVYHCTVAAEARRHGWPDSLTITHSRLNGLPRAALAARGYGIVSEAPGGLVDIFTKDFGAPHLFLQGHPEYDPDSLFREYRRDAGRFFAGQQAQYPALPENYFDDPTTARMDAFRAMAEAGTLAEPMQAFPEAAVRKGLGEALQQSSAAVFRAWFARLEEERKGTNSEWRVANGKQF